jgi:hypothetical protein
MKKQRDRFKAWFARWRGVRTSDEEAAVMAFADAYDAAVQSGELSPDQLATIINAANSSRALLWINATELLADLALRWEIAAQAIAEMFASRQSHVRFAALCCLLAKTPVSLSNRLLRNGLIDKSSRVRWKAAQKIGDFERTELLTELEAAFLAETNSDARAEMDLNLRLLRDGYIVKPSTPSRFEVTVRIKNGIRTGYVSEEEMQVKGIDVVTRELRNR